MRPFLNSISKAKAARLVRSLLDLFLDMEAATGQEVRLPSKASSLACLMSSC